MLAIAISKLNGLSNALTDCHHFSVPDAVALGIRHPEPVQHGFVVADAECHIQWHLHQFSNHVDNSFGNQYLYAIANGVSDANTQRHHHNDTDK